MATLVIGGNSKDVGKTALVCAVIRSLREFEWTVVKITGHDYQPSGIGQSKQTIREEPGAGSGTDTARFLAAGARRALLVTRSGTKIPIDEIRRRLGEDRDVIFESNRIADLIKPDVCLALVGNAREMKASFRRLLPRADAVVSIGAEVQIGASFGAVERFCLASAGQLTPEMAQWLRLRLTRARGIGPISR